MDGMIAMQSAVMDKYDPDKKVARRVSEVVRAVASELDA